MIKTNFLSGKVPKENEHYTCLTCFAIDSVVRMEKKNYLQDYLEEWKYRMKKKKMTKFMIESELESDIELKLKSDTK